MKKIVLTPTKNEEWIIELFLKITSLFADHIIIADQFSTDKTVEIAKKFPKVIIIENNNSEYDEQYRQKLLIDKARTLFPGNNLLLALDADEIITADSVNSIEWVKIVNQKPGTQIYFNKVDVLPGFKEALLTKNKFLIGFIDDGREHIGLKIHSPRVPFSNYKYESMDIQFMHLAITRNEEFYSKLRRYIVIENIENIDNLRNRYKKYSRYFIEKTINSLQKQILPNEWIQYDIYIDFNTVVSTVCNVYNKDVINNIICFGEKKFWLDDIWYIDFNSVAKLLGTNLNILIKNPPFYISIIRWLLIRIFYIAFKTKKHFSKITKLL